MSFTSPALAWNEGDYVGHLSEPLQMSGGLTEEDYWDATGEECALGAAASDAAILLTGADVALLAAGDLTRNIWAGDVYWEDVDAAFADDREIVCADVTAPQLRELLEYALSYIVLGIDEKIDLDASKFDGHPQFSGFYLHYDVSAPVGERVRNIILDDETIIDLDDENTILTLACTEYMLNGGYGYPAVVAEYTKTGVELKEAMAEYIASGITKSYESVSKRYRSFGSASQNSIYSMLPGGLVIVIIGIILLSNRSRLKGKYDFKR